MLLFVLAVSAPGCKPDDSWEQAMATGQRAAAQREFGLAERSFAGAVVKAERFGREDPRVAISLSQLAQVYTAQAKYLEAEPLYMRALKIYQSAHGERHPDVAATLNNIGVLHRMHGQYADAEPYLTRALALKESLLNPDDPDLALSVKNLGQLYVAQGQFDRAEPLFKRAVAIREKHPESLELAKSLDDYSAVLRKQQRDAEAEILSTRAKAIRGKLGRAS
jgi:tetratricopeptide (TPR) repeat protein